MECRACDECLYLCPISENSKAPCYCNEYYKREDLEKHVREVNEKAEKEAAAAQINSSSHPNEEGLPVGGALPAPDAPQ